jgi:tetratricopeptide (TPR) repeat protein
MRPPGSIQAAQKEVADDTRVFVKEALAETWKLRKYRLWVPMIERQMATAQLQLNWMIKDFRRVDELMPKAMLLDPNTVAIKLARQQMLGADLEEMEKTYRKGVRRLRYNQNVLLAATWSWILVRRGRVDEAFKALAEALRNSDDATLKRNHECLMNNKVAHFGNSGIGDQWYSLYLEEPKVKVQRPRSAYR